MTDRQRDIEATPEARDGEAPLRFQIRRPRQRVEVPPPGGDAKSVLAFSLHKAGSTMLYDILRAICPAAGLSFVSFEDELFLRGIPSDFVEVQAEFPETGYCFGGFRYFPYYPIPILGSAKAILLVRDPRDILVSLYFSNTYSHIPPGADGPLKEEWLAMRKEIRSMTIDDWVLESCGICKKEMEGYLAQQFATRANVAIYRYEDVIFRKRDWIEDLVNWYGWDVPEQLIAQTAQALDIIPGAADPTKHIRQVFPGNHKTMLKETTREKLNAAFSDLLSLFRYSVEGRS